MSRNGNGRSQTQTYITDRAEILVSPSEDRIANALEGSMREGPPYRDDVIYAVASISALDLRC